MNKKIIYLLVLITALSLMFAGCKKGLVAPTGGPEKDQEVKPPTNLGGNGLFDNQTKLDEYKEKPIQRSTEVAKYENENYMRNPVITVVGGTNVVVFYEIRYKTSGANNDVALTGENAVSIAYVQSGNSGISFSTSLGDVKYVGGNSTGANNAHGAPIVFNTGKQIVVVASAGIGLSRGVYNKEAGKVSKLQYSVASIGTDNNVGEFGAWQNMSDPGDLAKNGYTQFGTHSARGTVTESGTLLLPVTLANYQEKTSKFGYVLYTGTVDSSSGNVTWQQSGNVVSMPNDGDKVVKETRIPKGASDSDYVYLAVSSDIGKISQGKGAQNSSVTTIVGSDGSAGTLVVPQWYGAESYNPANYKNASGKQPQSILSHVLATEQNLAIRLVDDDFKNQQGKSFPLGGAYTGNSKSSSMDILDDGTIVMIAEGGKVAEAATRPFFIYFSRFSQAYIANQTK